VVHKNVNGKYYRKVLHRLCFRRPLGFFKGHAKVAKKNPGMLEQGRRLSSLEDNAIYDYSILNIAITINYGTRVNLLILSYNAYLSLMGFVESSA
jgi:hypothetical protein